MVVVLLGLIHLYLWWRLVRDTTRPGRLRRIGGIVTILLTLLVPATMIGTTGGVEQLSLLAWPGYLWIAVMFYLLVVLLALELPMLVARLVLRVRARRQVTAAEPTGVPRASAPPRPVWPPTGTAAAPTARAEPDGGAAARRPPAVDGATMTRPAGCCSPAARRSSPGSPPPD